MLRLQTVHLLFAVAFAGCSAASIDATGECTGKCDDASIRLGASFVDGRHIALRVNDSGAASVYFDIATDAGVQSVAVDDIPALDGEATVEFDVFEAMGAMPLEVGPTQIGSLRIDFGGRVYRRVVAVNQRPFEWGATSHTNYNHSDLDPRWGPAMQPVLDTCAHPFLVVGGTSVERFTLASGARGAMRGGDYDCVIGTNYRTSDGVALNENGDADEHDESNTANLCGSTFLGGAMIEPLIYALREREIPFDLYGHSKGGSIVVDLYLGGLQHPNEVDFVARGGVWPTLDASTRIFVVGVPGRSMLSLAAHMGTGVYDPGEVLRYEALSVYTREEDPVNGVDDCTPTLSALRLSLNQGAHDYTEFTDGDSRERETLLAR